MSEKVVSRAKGGKSGEMLHQDTKTNDVRMSNIIAAKGVADAIRTSLGPRGMDKMIEAEKGEVLITNDGATILGKMQVLHPAARMLVELSNAQDVEAGDGTTSVVVLAGSLLDACTKLLEKGIHSTVIAEGFMKCAQKAEAILRSIAIPVDMGDRDSLLNAASTSLSSKVVSYNSSVLAPMAVDAVLAISDLEKRTCNLQDVHYVKHLGGTIDDSELVEGLVFPARKDSRMPSIARVENAKIALIQFHLSAPKTDIDNKVTIHDTAQMDKIIKEEKKYIRNLCKKIQDVGCNVLLVQKSILRDAVSDMALFYLSKLKIKVIMDIDRDQIDFISRTLNCRPVAHVDSLSPDKMGHAALVADEDYGGHTVTKVTGIQNRGKTITVLLSGSNSLVLDECERSLHDALCVIRCLIKQPFLLVGGGAPEAEVFAQFAAWWNTLAGADQLIARRFAEALEVIPYTLAENAGLHPVSIVTQLRQLHQQGDKYSGINVKSGQISDMRAMKVLQPLLVSANAIKQAAEYVHMILKIDDMVATMK